MAFRNVLVDLYKPIELQLARGIRKLGIPVGHILLFGNLETIVVDPSVCYRVSDRSGMH